MHRDGDPGIPCPSDPWLTYKAYVGLLPGCLLLQVGWTTVCTCLQCKVARWLLCAGCVCGQSLDVQAGVSPQVHIRVLVVQNTALDSCVSVFLK